MQDLTDAFQTEVRARRELLEAAVSFYTKVKEIWKIFDELRVQRDGQGDVQQFERNRSDVKGNLQLIQSIKKSCSGDEDYRVRRRVFGRSFEEVRSLRRAAHSGHCPFYRERARYVLCFPPSSSSS